MIKYEVIILKSVLWLCMIGAAIVAFIVMPYRIITETVAFDVLDVMFLTLFEGFLILGLVILYGILKIVIIIQQEAISYAGVKISLKVILLGSFGMFLLFLLAMPFIVWVGETEDAPGAIVLGSAIMIASLMVFLLAKVISGKLRT